MNILGQIFSRGRILVIGKSTGDVQPIRETSRRCHPSSETGKSLPAALITLAVGSLLLTPFLAFVSSRSLGSRAAETTINAQYAADAGIEYAIWSLLNDPTFRTQADNNVNISQVIVFPDTINGYDNSTITISVTALPLGVWTPMASVPGTMGNIGAGGSLAYDGGNIIYSLVGGGSRSFGYYDITNNTWDSSLDNPGGIVSSGGSLAYDGNNSLYALRGGGTTDFWKYQTKSGNWNDEKDTLEIVGSGGNLVYAGNNNIYAFKGMNKNTFWQYKGNWLEGNRAPDNAPGNVGDGSDLIYHEGEKKIFALRGGGTSEFWQYDIDSDTWSSNLPPTLGVVSYGGNLAYHSGSYIYALQGSSKQFWRYNMDTNKWVSLAETPEDVGSGSDLVFTSATTGYASQGGGFTGFWKFQITPPRYDIHVEAGSVTTDTRIEINGLAVSVLFWDIY